MTRRKPKLTKAQEAEAKRAAEEAIERETRISTITEMVLVGSDDRRVQRAVRQLRWDLAPSDVQELIDEARAEVLERYRDPNREDIVAVQLAQLDDLYMRAVQNKQHIQAAKILQQQRLVLGIERADRGADASRRPRAIPEWLRGE